ncbi:class I SAM-dependent methyltransferase [Sphingomonas sp. BIUV-7]|uniref:Class I SAM-dependent methyltransferase n=1 Tax=Sphingomonas natans TaxID=3063330 RepID=A0ABT8Y9J0_9SPHN|nr:class I SAM-dependent methyltransferase [Sphingomonas sp. BIUV-7]MDO6414985.1 class I SAM-dependent methyltransferase [Sphingomonas sp. BIUV-7]
MDDQVIEQTHDYGVKRDEYFSTPRYDYVDLMPAGAASVLEIGCGTGATGHHARSEGKAAFCVGVEMFEPVAIKARDVLDAVHIGNIEQMDLPYEEETFDFLIMSEVLEHLIDPQAVVSRLVKLLKIGGRVFASSPNISHLAVIRHLMRGRFDYVEEGVMDKTHLRWFTPSSFATLFTEAGVTVDHLGSVYPSPIAHRLLAAAIGRPSAAWQRLNVHGHRTA